MTRTSVQYFDWGRIEWMYEPEYGTTNIMHIGIINIYPGKRQTKHVHYGDEQFLYVFSGKGEQFIDDVVNAIEPMASYHIEAGSIHETINTGDEPIVELLISIPAYYEGSLFLQRKVEDLLNKSEKDNVSFKIDEKIKGIYEGLASSMKMPLSVYDDEDNLVIKGQGYPEYCEVKCNVGNDLNNCCIYSIGDKYGSPQYSEPSAFICPYGLTVFTSPILFNDEVIGTIKGGHIRTSADNNDAEFDKAYEQIPIVPKARMKAVSLQIKTLCKNIINYYIFENTEVQLGKKEEIIQDISRHEMLLEKSLKSTQEKVLSIQINNHFLFNTLNAIAGLAIKENAFRTYESIINLSKMFRYSLKTGSNLVKLEDELDYLDNFIELMKLRYGDKLEVRFDVSPELKDIIIPFNCLQPILENCFVHGFKNQKNNMLIDVTGKRDKDSVIIEICDNGIGMDRPVIEALNDKLHLGSQDVVSGLMMIYSKLQLFYNRGFDFIISGAPNMGTTVKIVIYDKLV